MGHGVEALTHSMELAQLRQRRHYEGFEFQQDIMAVDDTPEITFKTFDLTPPNDNENQPCWHSEGSATTLFDTPYPISKCAPDFVLKAHAERPVVLESAPREKAMSPKTSFGPKTCWFNDLREPHWRRWKKHQKNIKWNLNYYSVYDDPQATKFIDETIDKLKFRRVAELSEHNRKQYHYVMSRHKATLAERKRRAKMKWASPNIRFHS